MPSLKEDVRASMTECIASFFAASQALKRVDISGYYKNVQEAMSLIGSLKQSDSLPNIEMLKVYKENASPSEQLVDEHAQFIEMSSALKIIDTGGVGMKESSIAQLLSSLS